VRTSGGKRTRIAPVALTHVHEQVNYAGDQLTGVGVSMNDSVVERNHLHHRVRANNTSEYRDNRYARNGRLTFCCVK
jgi:hypothetical protein